MLDVLDNFLWTLRREGFALATPQAIDVARAVREVGFHDRAVVREAIACVVVDSAERRKQFDGLFDEFFGLRLERPSELTDRLLAQGLARSELAALRDLLREFLSPQGGGRLRALLTGGPALDHLLASESMQEIFGRMNNRTQKGFYTHQALEEVGIERARSAVSILRDGLLDALGPARAQLLVQALMRELDRSERRVRDQIEKRLEALADLERSRTDLMSRTFSSLSEAEIEEVRKAVRHLAERLRGAARVRNRHRKRGRLDATRTVRKSLSTGGVPFRPVRRDQRRDRPRLVVLCDVSDSVRPASRFMLEFVYAVKELFDRTRSFVFVSDVGEVTRIFEEEQVGMAIAKAKASILGGRENSSYGRAFRKFDELYSDAVDRRTTLVILGDGRTNYQPNGVQTLGRIRERAKSVLWLCPEPRASWGVGDSAMTLYAEKVTEVLEVACATDLERAARELVRRR
jgi:uncharacterized protein with von Willebrand factor type A (vWA) domain